MRIAVGERQTAVQVLQVSPESDVRPADCRDSNGPAKGLQRPDQRIELFGIPQVGEIEADGSGPVRRSGNALDQVFDSPKQCLANRRRR